MLRAFNFHSLRFQLPLGTIGAVLLATVGCTDVKPFEEAAQQAKDELVSLQKQLDETVREKAAILKQRDDSTDELKKAQTELASAQEVASNLQSEVKDLSGKLKETMEVATTTEAKLRDAIEEANARREDMTKLSAVVDAQKEQAVELNSKLATVTKEKDHITKTLAGVESKLQLEIENATRLTAITTSMKKLHEKTIATLNKEKNNNSKLSASLAEIEKRRDAYSDQLAASEKKLATALVDLKVAKSQIEEQAKFAVELQQKIDSLQKRSLALNSNLNVSEHAGEQWLSTIKRLQADRLEKKKEIAAHDAMVEETITEVTNELIDSLNKRIRIKETVGNSTEDDLLKALREQIALSTEVLKESQAAIKVIQEKQSAVSSNSPSDAKESATNR